MVDAPITADYQKPFYLFPWNKPKQPEPKKKKVADFREKPSQEIRYNQATKLRDKVIKAYATRESEQFIDYRALSHETAKTLLDEPEFVPKDTKVSAYRYKWVREVPVVSCRFTEHVIMFHKPPFSYAKPTGRCGQYRLRNMKIKEPAHAEEPLQTEKQLIPSILQG